MLLEDSSLASSVSIFLRGLYFSVTFCARFRTWVTKKSRKNVVRKRKKIICWFNSWRNDDVCFSKSYFREFSLLVDLVCWNRTIEICFFGVPVLIYWCLCNSWLPLVNDGQKHASSIIFFLCIFAFGQLSFNFDHLFLKKVDKLAMFLLLLLFFRVQRPFLLLSPLLFK